MPLCIRPTVITASLEKYQYVTTACQIVDAHVTLQGRTTQVQTIYHKDDIIAM